MEYKDFSMMKAQKEAGDVLFGDSESECLTERERILIGIVTAATRGCPECTGARIKDALNRGIDEKTVNEAVNLSAAINSGFTITMAINGMKKIK
jgi:AhpD family alkylhydroperoxidase